MTRTKTSPSTTDHRDAAQFADLDRGEWLDELQHPALTPDSARPARIRIRYHLTALVPQQSRTHADQVPLRRQNLLLFATPRQARARNFVQFPMQERT